MWQMTPSEVVLPAAKLVIKLQGYTCFLVVQDMHSGCFGRHIWHWVIGMHVRLGLSTSGCVSGVCLLICLEQQFLGCVHLCYN